MIYARLNTRLMSCSAVTMASNWLFLQGERAYTGKCEIRYREPAITGTRLLLEGELLSRKGRHAKLAGRVMHPEDRRVLAEAAATFIVMA